MDTKTRVLEALDDLSSTRSSLSRRSRALNNLERLLAELCLSPNQSCMEEFLELQNSFEGNSSCVTDANFPYDLPPTSSTTILIGIQSRHVISSSNAKAASDIMILTQHTQQALSILQGVALIHRDSKTFLGRKSSIHLLLDILSISRHAPVVPVNTSFPPNATSASSDPSSNSPPMLASAVLDTLLCVLVDCPEALRVFEEANGIEAIVKTLKRSGVAREVRMKCLEFLYFYLLPEDGSSPSNGRCTSSPARPLSTEDPLTNCGLPTPSKSVPGSPVHASFIVAPFTPVSSTTNNEAVVARPRPSGSATSEETAALPGGKVVALQMLKKEIDYVPLSPKKVQVAMLGVGTPGRPRNPNTPDVGSGVSRSSAASDVSSTPRLIFPSFSPATPGKKRGTLLKSELKVRLDRAAKHSQPEPLSPDKSPSIRSTMRSKLDTKPLSSVFGESTNTTTSAMSFVSASPPKAALLAGGGKWPSTHPGPQQAKPRIRSTEEKKELLGNWIGNVDALVAGVQKAGVWGLA
ncbi:hypothetical protein FRB99_005518 [Tulasnella sp. 403]|nr:hypothetical protein FRB99_005518 [Tulasnella sp. 403]